MSLLQTLLALVVLIYVLCVIVQFMQEGVKALLDTKAKTMEKVVGQFMGENLLKSDQVKNALLKRGFQSLAALEHFSKEDFRQLLDTIPIAEDQRQEISNIVGTANATVDQFRQHAEASYDAAMAKFQRLYAATNKKWVIAISFVVVLTLNASAIKIYEILAVEPAVAAAIAAKAASVAPPNQDSAAAQAFNPDKTRQDMTQQLQDYPILLRTLKYPTDIKDPANDIGLLIMATLVSLGAPFWNDVLKGMMGINNALNTGGKKPS